MGSYCDIATKCTIIQFPKAEDITLERFKVLIADLDYMLEDYDSEHLLHALMDLKKAMALYMFFSEEYEFYE